jgi:hypothetical protein
MPLPLHVNLSFVSDPCLDLKLLGSDLAWMLSDTKLVSKDLRLARRRAESEQESKIEQEEILKERRD